MIPKLERVMDEVARLPEQFVEAATERFDEIAQGAAARATGGSMDLHGRGGKRTAVKLATRSVVLGAKAFGGRAAAYAVIVGTPTAMWVWLEKGTASHTIGFRRNDKTTYLHGAGYSHPIAGPMVHPGARGKGTWTQAVDTFRTEFPQLIVKTKQEVIRRASR